MSTKTECPRFFADSEIRVIDGDNGKRTLVGYVVRWNTRSGDLGGFREEVAPGAFTEYLKSGAEVLALVNHDPTLVLGRKSAGTLRLEEDKDGLRFEIDPPNTTVGNDAVENVRRQDVKGMSFRFPKGATDSWRMDGGVPIRTLLKAGLREVTLTAIPAYEATSVSLRALTDAEESELRSYYQKQIDALKPEPDLSQIKLAEKRLRLLGGESRATIQYDDPSLVYVCRDAIALGRAAFDRLQAVVDVASKVTGTLSVADKQAADDCVSTIIDLLGKAKLARTTLQGLGAVDDNSGAAA